MSLVKKKLLAFSLILVLGGAAAVLAVVEQWRLFAALAAVLLTIITILQVYVVAMLRSQRARGDSNKHLKKISRRLNTLERKVDNADIRLTTSLAMMSSSIRETHQSAGDETFKP